MTTDRSRMMSDENHQPSFCEHGNRADCCQACADARVTDFAWQVEFPPGSEPKPFLKTECLGLPSEDHLAAWQRDGYDPLWLIEWPRDSNVWSLYLKRRQP